MPSPLQSFEGIGNANNPLPLLPPDTDGDVGPDHYVQMVNVSFAIYSKAGTLLYGPAANNTLWSGFGGPCETRNDGDPIVLYDPLADRWLMSQFAIGGPYYECIAVSQSANPTGSWHRYAFLISTTKLNDYPKFGVWPDAYYMSVNQFRYIGPDLTWAGAGAVAFERDRMLQGLPADMVYFDIGASTLAFGGMLPADLDGSTPPPLGAPNPFVEVDDDAWGWPTDRLHVFNFDVNWPNPASSTFSLPPSVVNTASFESNLCDYERDCIPQPGVADTAYLDAISDRLMFRLQYRNLGTHQAMVTNHTVFTGQGFSAIRWYELRSTGGGWSINQQGTYAPGDGLWRWMGSIAVDGQGNMALGYSAAGGTGPAGYPSIRYVGRLAGDAPGTMPQSEATLMAGGGSQTSDASRWGDYSAMAVDPNDGCTFWYTNEYYATTSSSGWKTRIGSFRFPTCTDAEPPLNPTVSSPSHTPSVWSQDPTVEIIFGGPPSADTDGFSYLFDTSPTTVSDTTKDAEETATGTTSGVLPEGDSHWFHLRTRDNAGNWSAAAHIGPFWIDASAPSPAGLLAPDDGATVTTSSPELSWRSSSDAGSGLAKYQLFIDGALNRDNLPPDTTSTTPTNPLPDGPHTWRIRALDNLGNFVDSTQRSMTVAEPPLNPSVSSPSHTPSVWSQDPTVEIIFGGPLSADTDGFSYLFDTSPTTVPDTTKDAEETDTRTASPSLPDGASHWFHIRTVDDAGNWSVATHFGPILIDTTTPTDPTLSSPSHQVNVPSSDRTIDITWAGAADAGAGVDGFSFEFSPNPSTVPDPTKDAEETATGTTSPELSVGDSYWFHLRTSDGAGNWTSTVRLGPFPIEPAPSDKTASTTTVRAKVKRKIKVSGTLIPAHEGSEVLVTLFKKKGGFRQVKQVAATVNAEGRFGAAFKVPNAKRCRVTATWESDGDHLGSSAKTTFSC